MNNNERLLNKTKGDTGEDAAAGFLMGKNYHIIERNFRVKTGEIDIVAMDKDILVFVEVKQRKSNVAEAFSSVSAAKKKRLIRAAYDFLEKNPDLAGKFCRFDVVAVISNNYQNEYCIHHLENAFTTDEVCFDG